MDLDEWPSIEKIQKSGIYYTNKEVIIGEKNSNESENSNDTENQNQIININQSQNMLNENIKKMKSLKIKRMKEKQDLSRIKMIIIKQEMIKAMKEQIVIKFIIKLMMVIKGSQVKNKVL